MSVYLDDGDVTLYLGDALETVRAMPDESVDCVVTSPPYWGLRDYGTGEWDGGDPDCAHRVREDARVESSTLGGGKGTTGHQREGFKDECPRCGARRVDQQMGLEPTPDLFVNGMVELFREIRRVLAAHGTCWVNLGDSYATTPTGNRGTKSALNGAQSSEQYQETLDRYTEAKTARAAIPEGLKPKDLVGIPWRVAFALQQDGWWLRSDIIWAKPNPMPESVTDRPTKAHEYVFLLTKQPRYWFDAEAVREPHTPDSRKDTTVQGGNGSIQHRDGERWPGTGRNVRSVWTIATQPYPEAHFATYPEELARRCILAGCPTRVCVHCNKPWERHIEKDESDYARLKREQGHGWRDMDAAGLERGVITKEGEGGQTRTAKGTVPSLQPARVRADHGFRPSCTCGTADVSALCDDNLDAELACGEMPVLRPGLEYRPGVVLDPFIGSGTTAKVARDHQRHAIGIDLNQEYLELAARRLQQLSLLT